MPGMGAVVVTQQQGGPRASERAPAGARAWGGDGTSQACARWPRKRKHTTHKSFIAVIWPNSDGIVPSSELSYTELRTRERQPHARAHAREVRAQV